MEHNNLNKANQTTKAIFKIKEWPTLGQWKQLYKFLSKKERIALLVFFFFFFGSAIFLVANLYTKHSAFRAAAGGSFAEGVIGQPRWLNPIYAAANDVDRDLTELIFSGLVKYNEKGEIVPDLAKSYEIKEDGQVFEFYLRENLTWQDGQPLTQDDIVFTIETLQNSDYKSPLRANWLGVEIEKIGRAGIRLRLKKPYAPFLETATVKILPKHIWQDIPPERFSLSPYNLNPIGSGHYKLKKVFQDKLGYIQSLDLERNKKYFGKKPFIPKIKFLFFENQEQLTKAAKQGSIQSLSLTLPHDLSFKNGFRLYDITLPRYFAVFFNQEKSDLLTDSKVRQALNYGTDKQALIDELFQSFEKEKPARLTHSPILPALYDYTAPSTIYDYDLQKANELLEQTGFVIPEGKSIREKPIKKQGATAFKKDLKYRQESAEVKELQKCLALDPKIYPEAETTGYFGPATKRAVIRFQEKYAAQILKPWGFTEGTGIVGKTTREKLNEVCHKSQDKTLSLKITLATANEELLVSTAELLKKQWAKLGIEVETQIASLSELEKDFIKKRNYEALLFGEALGSIPDLFPFWHSSQKKDPGANLSLYSNKKADKLLEQARESLDEKKRAEIYETFQEILIKDNAAVFLYSPSYIYLVSKKIKGIDIEMIVDPSRRFCNIEQWYIKTKRKWQ